MEGVAAAIERFELKHFAMPFPAHALGTLVGAFVAAKIAKGRGTEPAVIVGVFFLIGGIAAASTIGAPMWFNAVDIALAYIPMAYSGAALADGAPRPAE